MTLAKPTVWYPGIQRDHWLADHLVSAWVMNEGAGQVMHDTMGFADGVLTGSKGGSFWQRGGDVGCHLEFTSGANRWIPLPARDWGLFSLIGREFSECTVIIKARVDASINCLFEFTADGSSNTGFLAFLQSPNMRWRVMAGGRTTGQGTIAYAQATGVEGIWAFTYSEHAGQFIYLDGVQRAGDASKTGSFNDAIDDVASFGALATGPWKLAGWIDYALLWNRAFTGEQIRRVTADPLEHLRPPVPVASFVAATPHAGPLVNGPRVKSKLRGLVG